MDTLFFHKIFQRRYTCCVSEVCFKQISAGSFSNNSDNGAYSESNGFSILISKVSVAF